MSLTDTQIRAIRRSKKRARISDSGGLFLEVLPSGRKVFRLAYRVAGSQRTKLIGDYPLTSLADARLKASAFKLDLNSSDPKIVELATSPKPTIKMQKREATTWREVADG